MITVTKPFVGPADDVACNSCKEVVACRLVCMDVVLEQLRVVVRHFFEMRHYPSFIHGVPMEAAGQLIVNTSTRHFLESCGEEFFELLVA